MLEEAGVGQPLLAEENELSLSLEQAIDRALERNLGLSIIRFRPAISREDVTIAQAMFDPQVFATGDVRERTSPQAGSDLDGVGRGARTQTSAQVFSLGAEQRFSPGTTVGLETGFARSTTNSARAFINPEYNSDVALVLRQPLLRGAGQKVNLADIAKARIGMNRSRLEVRREVLDVIAAVEIAYWNLSASNARKSLFESNLRLAESLLQENRERLRLGVATRLDVLQAEANLASRSEDVILAQQAVENAEDNLRELLGALNLEEMIYSLRVTALPDEDPGLIPFEVAVRGALAQDMDLQIQYEILDQLQIDEEVARNNTLPTLNLRAGAGLLGREADGFRTYESTFRGRGHEWNAGLELRFPWGRRADKARLSQSRQDLAREEFRLAHIQQELLRRLRMSWRAVSAARERMETTSASVELNRESFERERISYETGVSSFRDVLQAQSDLDTARLRHLEAQFDLIESTVRLSRLDGQLLDRHGFEWDDLDSRVQTAPTREDLRTSLRGTALLP